MAFEFYCTIEGTKQGAFKGESVREAHKDKIPCISYHHEIKSAKDISHGKAAGKRQHGPITITKEWGAATPQIFQALVTNEVLTTVLFEFIHTTDDGTEEIYHTIKLLDASINKVVQSTGGGAGGGESTAKTQADYDTHEQEAVSFTYRRVEVDNLLGQTSASDDWTQ